MFNSPFFFFILALTTRLSYVPKEREREREFALLARNALLTIYILILINLILIFRIFALR